MHTQSTRLIAAILAVGMLTISLGSAQADELLAGGSLQDLIGGGETTPKPDANQPGLKGVNKQNLGAALKAAGFEVKEMGNNAFEFSIKRDVWTFPFLVSLSRDETVMWFTVALKPVKSEAGIPHDKMLAMLTANRKYGPNFFEFLAKYKRFQLTLPLPNKDLTPDKVKVHASRLADIALETETLWNPDKWAQPTGTAAKHVGTWKATSGQTSFQLTLGADGSFTLVTNNAAGQKTSRGRYTMNDNALLLTAADGDKIEATILFTGNDNFAFRIKGSQGNALQFSRG